jgi:hypothetical protein
MYKMSFLCASNAEGPAILSCPIIFPMPGNAIKKQYPGIAG